MATKYVHDTAAGRIISAYVILNKRGKHVATVRMFHGSSVLVNVWNHDADAQLRCAKTRKLKDVDTNWAHKLFYFQHGRAGGYGYDKATAALSGLIIDGHEMTNHCDARLKPPKGTTLFPRDYKVPPGYALANWLPAKDGKPEGYMDCYRREGLEYLKAIGYQVITAV